MAKDSPEASQAVNLSGGQSITLDQLVSSTASAVLRTLREHDRIEFVNPKIWCGIWVDLDRLGGKLNQRGPG